MKADALYTLLAPAAMMSNKHALAAQNRALMISNDLIAAKSTFGMVEIAVELTGFDEPVFVDATVFMAVLNSMPPGEELKLKCVEEAITWKCGAASGKLATMVIDTTERIEVKNKKSAWPVLLELAEGIDLGSLSCENNTLAAIGMYGIVIDNRDGVIIYACDNVTVSACFALTESIPNAPDVITLAPDAAQILSAAMKRGTNGKLQFDNENVYYRSDTIRLLLSQSAALDKDISVLLDLYKDGKKKNIITIPPTRIAAFVSRVNAIADSKKDAHVTLRVDDGKIALSFESGTASSDEYYMADGLSIPKDMAPVALKADKLARAMRYVQGIDISHIGKGVIVLRGDAPKFRYMISGSVAE